MSSIRPRPFAIALLVLSFALIAQAAYASHFRYGYMFWERDLNYFNAANPNQVKVTVTIETGARWTYTWPSTTLLPTGYVQPGRCLNNPTVCCSGTPNPGLGGSDACPPLGSMVQFIGSNGVQFSRAVQVVARNGYTLATPINVAASGFVPMDVLVNQVAAVQDTFYGRFSFTMLMDKTAPVELNWTNNARISQLLDSNNDRQWTLKATVDFTGPNAFLTRSPQSSVSAVILVFSGQNNVINLPSVAFDNLVTGWRIATAAESQLLNPTPLAPSVFALNSATGQVNFTPRTTGFYSVQFRLFAKDPNTGVEHVNIPVDVMFQAVTPTVTTTTLATTDGQTSYTATVGQPLSFTMRSTLAPNNPSFTTTISNTVLPAGATTIGGTCTGPATCDKVFTWTPQVSSTAALVCFTSNVTSGATLITASPQSCVTINLNPLETRLTVYPTEGTAGGGPLVLSAKLERVHQTAPLPGRTVNFTYDANPTNPPWVGTASAVTDANGVATAVVTTVGAVNPPSPYTATFNALAGEYLSASAGSSLVSIKRATTSVNAPTGSTNPLPSVGFPLPISAVLNRHWTDGGIYGVGATLDFSLTTPGGAVSQISAGPTNISGVATATFPAPAATGNYTATASFAGNDALNGGVTSPVGTITVRQRTQVTMSAGVASQNVSSPVSATVVAIPSGQPVGPGRTVTFTTAGATINTATATTNAAGVATANFTWSTLGAKTVTASYTPTADELNRNGLAAADSSAANTDVQAAAATTVVLGAFNGTSGTPTTIGATLRTTATSAPVAGATVTFAQVGGGSLGSGITQADGTVSVALTPAAAFNGQYTASFTGMPGYAASSATAAFTIVAATTAVSDLTIAATNFVGDTVAISAALTRTSAPAGPAAGQAVTFTLTGDAGNPGGATVQTLTGTTNAAGIAQVSFPATARGQFTVGAAFAGGSSLAPSTSGNASATVYQKVTLSLQGATGVTGVPAQLSAQLVTVPGSVPLSGQTISFSLAPGSPATPTAVTAADGVASVTTTFGAAGSYTVSAQFQSASAFYANALGQVAPSVASGIVAINRATSALSTPLITSGQPIVGQPVAVRSVLSRVTNPAGPVAGLVTFTFTGPGGSVTSLATSAGADGVASTTFNATARGPYTVSASFAGSSSLDASTSAATAFSATQNTTLTLAPVSAIAGGQATVSATLIASPQNTPVAGQIVNFSFGGAALSTDAVTDANGVASVAVSFPSATFVSAHATFNAANDYAGSTADAGIAVASAQTALSPLMVPSTSLVGDTLTVATTLTRTSVPAGVVANVPLTFRLASPAGVTQTVSAMTDANGLAQASFTLVNRGAFSVTVQFAGDTALEAAQRSADLSVYQRTNLVVNAATGVAGALTPISATLLTIPGNTPLAGQTVDFSFNGVVPPSSATTDGNGTGGVSSVFVSGGTFPVTASFSNLADYFVDANGNAIPTTASTNLTIARATTSLGALSAPSFSAVSNVLTVSTTLTRTSAPAGPAAGETVFFTVTAPDGSTTFSGSAVSAANGQVSFVFTPVMKGAHTISASFAATAGLDASSANAVSVAVYQRTTLTVAPATGSATKPFTVSATLATMPGGAPIAGQPVSFSFTDGSWATATTNAQGVAQVTVTIAAVGDYTATATFSDAAGFYADSTGAFPVVPTTGSGVVHVTNNPPAFTAVTVPAVEATSPNGAAVMFTAGGNDAEDGPLNAVCAPTSGSIFAVGQTTVSCTVTDSAQATATGSFIVTVQDTTAPVVTVPTIAPAFATSAAGRVIDYTASAADIVDGSTATACVPVSGSIFALGQTTVTCTSSDSRGNTASATFVVTVNNNAPTFTTPADVTKEATGAPGAIATFAPMGADVEDGPIAAVCVPASGSTFPIGASTVSCTVTDAANQTAAATFTVTVGDTTAPVLTLPVIAPASATSAAGRPVTFSATAVDIVDTTPTVVCVPASGSIFPIGDTTVTCTATDDHNNSKSGTFTVTVTNNAPTFAPPSSITTEATSANGAVVSFTAEGNDLEEGTLQAVCAPASGSTFPVGATTVSCIVTDVAQATATGSFTVTVGDTTAPVLTLPAIAPAFATSANGNVVNYTATALDIVDGSTAVTCSPASGSTFPIATTTVTCSTSDTRGNTSTGSFDVTITNTAPTIADLLDLSGEATGSNGRAFTFTSTGNDAEDGALTPVCTANSGTFPIGTTTVSCTVTDVAGATATDSFTITVVDTTAPVLTLPAIAPAFATSANGNVVNYTATALDIVDGSTAVTCSPASGSTFPIATTTVNCSTSDTRGNTSTGSFTVSITNTAPTIVDLPNLAGEATSAAGRAFTFTSTGNDNEDGPKTPVCTASSGTFPIGTTTVSCTVTDVAGATATDWFTITVVDTTKPVVTVPANITTTQNIPAGRVVTYSGQSATDAVTNSLTTSCVPASGSTFAVGTTTVACSATDAAGNTGTNTFTVTVNPSGTTTVGPGQTMTFSGGTLGGNVNVNGGTLILTNGTTVSGNVQMQPGSTLTVNTGSSVGGNVQLAGTGAVNVTGGTVGGNLQLSNGAVFNIGPGAVMQGQVQLSNTPAGRPTSTMCGASVAKNVQIDGNASPVFIGSTPACAGNTIAGQVQIQSNSAAIRVFGNMISKQLQCSSNTGGITGGSNTASGKSGQCSAF